MEFYLIFKHHLNNNFFNNNKLFKSCLVTLNHHDLVGLRKRNKYKNWLTFESISFLPLKYIMFSFVKKELKCMII